MVTVVFLGPSLPVAEAREILPGAIYLPPAAQADIASAVKRYEPDVIALIDGVFLQSLSVWHKEILYALERGVAVLGASSMGALRAAECTVFGMVGVGQVFKAYASGELNDDDEVALAHADGNAGYRAASLPLVNLRATLRRAVADELIDDAEAQLVIASTREIYFPERTRDRIVAAARDAGLPSQIADRLRTIIQDRWVDAKRQDALELLRRLRDRPPPKPVAVEPLQRSHVFEALLERDRRVTRDGGEISLEEIGIFVSLNRPGLRWLRAAANYRDLVLQQAEVIGIEVTPDEVQQEVRRFCLAHGLNTPERIETWRVSNDLDVEEFETLMRQEAILRRMEDWARVQRFKRGSTRCVLDWLRLSGEYPDWADRALEAKRLAEAHGAFPPDTQDDGLESLLIRHVRETGWRPDGRLDVLADEIGLFWNVEELREELGRASRARTRLAWLSSRDAASG